MTQRAHGFVWPSGMPACVMCGRDANDQIHVTPARTGGFPQMPMLAADLSDNKRLPMRAHSYLMASPNLANQVQCQACGSTLAAGVHAVGLPAGVMPASSNSGMYGGGGGLAPATLAKEQAFVAEVGHRLVFAAPATTDFTADQLPREVATAFQQASEKNPNNLWLAGRYVEADRPNRNAAFWSTEDLELGQPTVAHGPINWLHEEKHIIGAIAASEMVTVDREAAAATGVGNHIAALGAVWSYIYPAEARLVQQASENSKLWFSMECVSREVACLTCDTSMDYRAYMDRSNRCAHMTEGLPRRFVDPTFGGAAVIVPPVRPGWANADARVLMPQAAALAERQAASLTSLNTADAELLVAEILARFGTDELTK